MLAAILLFGPAIRPIVAHRLASTMPPSVAAFANDLDGFYKSLAAKDAVGLSAASPFVRAVARFVSKDDDTTREWNLAPAAYAGSTETVVGAFEKHTLSVRAPSTVLKIWVTRMTRVVDEDGRFGRLGATIDTVERFVDTYRFTGAPRASNLTSYVRDSAK